MQYFRRRTGDRAEAEDLTQQVFLRIIATETDVAIEQASGLIFITAGNLLIDRSRRGANRISGRALPLDSFRPDEVTGFSPAFVEDRDPERVLMGKDTLEAALAALDELGQRTKDIFILTRLENMKQADVARLLGISVSTVEKHLIRGLAHLALFRERQE